MPAIGDPPPPAVWQEPRTFNGSAAPVSYVPAPVKQATAGFAGSTWTRPGGRRAEESRACHFRIGTVPNAAGSAYIEQGRTKVIATIYGPRQAADRGQQAAAEGILWVDFQFAQFSSRAPVKEENDKRALLYNTILQSTLESIVLLERYAKAVFDVNVLVLEDHGGVLTAAVTAASLALADAGAEMRDLAAGATVHLVPAPSQGAPATLLLDCDGDEEQALPEGSAVLHLGLCPSRGKLCLLHSVGPLPLQPFEQMVLLAKETAEAVGTEMRKCLERRVEHRANKRARLSNAAAEGTDRPEEDHVIEDAYE